MKKKYLYMLFLLVICLLGFVLSPTLAKFTSNYTTDEDIVGLSFDFNIGISNIEEYEEINVAAGEVFKFNVEVSNNSSNTLYYGVWYKLINPSELPNSVTIARLEGTETTTSGSIDSNDTKTVTVIILNNSDESLKINIGVVSSTTSTEDIEYLDGRKLISGTAEEPAVWEVNSPNLDSGMIPVKYDDTNGVWIKADSTNSNNSWYDYDNKIWANAVLISDSTKRGTYQSATVGTEIPIDDITAFYVWIPRFKYKVWNITRRAGDETTYAYPAYTEGIDIEFEEGTASTGNVTCTYDTSVAESVTTLSDTCIYNGTDTITTESVNANYTDAWYTHPAFKFGSKQVTGFWMGKFETGGTASAPVVKPDVQSLRSQIVSAQFTTSKVVQSYGLSSDIDAHMLTNLEWGAVAYFMYSNYGLCDSSGCRDAYFNNSSNHYTGRSYGNFSADSVYTTSGTYSYDGYTMTDATTKSSEKNINKIASTTGNIYGVYDMNGGVNEYVMGNMVDSSNSFYPSLSGTDWNESSTLDAKYYNSYSYGTNYYKQIAFNRSRLGDATAEITASNSIKTASWKPGVGITGAGSYFVYSSNSWFNRGGNYNSSYVSSFRFGSVNGNSSSSFSFRSSLS